jgi:hypothetical protein
LRESLVGEWIGVGDGTTWIRVDKIVSVTLITARETAPLAMY